MDGFKAVFLGGLLTFVVSLVVGSNGSSGGHLAIHEIAIRTSVQTIEVFWSWPLFLSASGIAYGLIVIQR